MGKNNMMVMVNNVGMYIVSLRTSQVAHQANLLIPVSVACSD